MKIVIGSDSSGFDLKEKVKAYLKKQNYEIIDVSEVAQEDFVESSLAVTDEVLKHDFEKSIMFDEYGVGSAMASNKVKGMITANVTEENTARMTAMHNGAKAISIGTSIVGEKLAYNIIQSYLDTKYAAGRHQVRIDMLNKMI